MAKENQTPEEEQLGQKALGQEEKLDSFVEESAPIQPVEKRKSNASVDPDKFDWDAFEKDGAVDTNKEAEEKSYSDTLSKINTDEVVEGTVVGITKREVIVNIGYKSEGVIPISEFRYNDALKVGDTVEVYVENAEDKKGQLLLSHKKARSMKSWDKVTEAYDKGDIVKGFIKCRTKGGMREPFDSDFEGIGVEFAIIDDTITVQDAIAGGPSYDVGIVAGDKIVSADGKNLAGVRITNDGVRSVLRGKKGTTVNLEVVRHGVAERLDFKVVRDRIPNKSVYAAYEVSPGILYIKLSRFAENSAEEVGMPILDHSGAIKGIILDLRGNSGGLLNSALSISNFFLKRGETMLSTAGRMHGEHSEFANGRGMYQQGPLVVLVDENSASASEIVTGALQDWDRAVVIGRRTFGKGLVQQVFDLSDGSEMRLTTDRYLTPSGRLIQTPYKNGKADEYYKAFLERFKKGESFYRDSIHLPDSLKNFTKKSHRAIYGGGGIMPDIFVPRDTSYYTDFYDKILRQGTVVEFMNSYTDRNRDRLHLKYTDFNQFDREYEPDDRMMDDFIAFAKSKKIACPSDQVEDSRDEVKNYMRAEPIRRAECNRIR